MVPRRKGISARSLTIVASRRKKRNHITKTRPINTGSLTAERIGEIRSALKEMKSAGWNKKRRRDRIEAGFSLAQLKKEAKRQAEADRIIKKAEIQHTNYVRATRQYYDNNSKKFRDEPLEILIARTINVFPENEKKSRDMVRKEIKYILCRGDTARSWVGFKSKKGMIRKLKKRLENGWRPLIEFIEYE